MMKKSLLCLPAIILLFFCGCKKDHAKPDTGSKLYNVKYNFSGFTDIEQAAGKTAVNTIGLQQNPPSSSPYLTKLYYLAYSSSGSFVSELALSSDSSSFTPITDKLAAGTYNVFFIAGDQWLQLGLNNSWAGNSQPQGNLFYPGAAAIDYPWHDTFFKAITITVSDTDINQNVNLARIVGQLEVNIEDKIPASAAQIKLTIDSEFGTYSYLPLSADSTFALTHKGITGVTSVTYTIPNAAKNQPNFKIYEILMNTITPFKVTITCLDAYNNVIATNNVNNVTCQKNRRTILSGKLFGSGSGSASGFNPVLNNTWDPIVNVEHF